MPSSETATAGDGDTADSSADTLNTDETAASDIAPDAPLVADDPSVWHPIRCGRVRDADDVQSVEVIGQRELCRWCQLFVDQDTARAEVSSNGN
jgi:hypothetical protein